MPDEDYFDACELTDLMGVKAIEMLEKAKVDREAKMEAEAIGCGCWVGPKGNPLKVEVTENGCTCMVQ